MMRYTVVWHQLAEDELIELWMAADDKDAVTSAVHTIDTELGTNPADQGTRVSQRSRELTVTPLQVLYRLREDDRIVEVFSVARI